MQQKMALVQTADDLEKRVLDALQNSGMPELVYVSVEIEYDRVILRGDVRTYYAKQMAQALVSKVDGVPAIKNDVFVTFGKNLEMAR